MQSTKAFLILFTSSLKADNVITAAPLTRLPELCLAFGRGFGVVVQGILLSCCLDP